MFHLIPQAAYEFRLLPWRDNVAFRREIIRTVALNAIDNGITELRDLIRELHRLVRYSDMNRKDRNNFDQSVYHLRQIVTGWHLLDPGEQHDFRYGKVPPSSLSGRIINAKRARKRKVRRA